MVSTLETLTQFSLKTRNGFSWGGRGGVTGGNGRGNQRGQRQASNENERKIYLVCFIRRRAICFSIYMFSPVKHSCGGYTYIS